MPVEGNPYTKLRTEYNCPEAEESFRQKRNKENFHQLTQCPELTPDPILKQVIESGPDSDTRHNLGIVARPTEEIREFIKDIQESILDSISSQTSRKCLFAIPEPWLHMTCQEICHSTTAHHVNTLVQQLEPFLSEILEVADSNLTLYKPLVSFDEKAIALSFISKPPTNQSHYRELLYDKITTETPGLAPKSRYSNPSAHITIVRFIDKPDPTEIKRLLDRVASINDHLSDNSLTWVFNPGTCEAHYGTTWYGKGTVIIS